MTLVTTRSRTAGTNEDFGSPVELPDVHGVDTAAGLLLSSSRSLRRTTDRASSRNPLRQSAAANLPDAAYDGSFPRLSRKAVKPRRNTPYASGRPTINAGDVLNDQRGRIMTWKEIARKKETRDKQPTTEHQRLVMVMVFNEITPYPPEDWISLIGGLVNRSTAQVDIFFSNTRQKLKRNAGDDYPPEHVRACKAVDVGKDRPVKMRRSALKLCPAEKWTDAFIEEIVMIYNFRALMHLRQREAAGERTSS